MDDEIALRYGELRKKVPEAIAQDADGFDAEKDAVDAFCRWLLTGGLRERVSALLDELDRDVGNVHELLGDLNKGAGDGSAPDDAYLGMLQGCLRAHLDQIRWQLNAVLANAGEKSVQAL